MARQIQLRRGTTGQHSTFTGAPGEVTVDIDKKTLVVHDGFTVGGTEMAKNKDVAPYINPQFSNTYQILYVDGTSGSDSNDGTTLGTAKRTIQAAINTIPLDYLSNITIDIADGTYNENVKLLRKLSAGSITFQGKKDGANIPTVIIDGTGLGSVDGISIQNGYVIINDIKVQNFPNDGIRCDFSPFVGINNVHTFNCGALGYEGVRSSRSAVQMNNCLIDGNNSGNNGAIAYNGFLSIINSTIKNVVGYGAYYSAGGWGHCDYNIIEKCQGGLVARVGGNPTSQGCTIKDCTYGVFSEGAYVFYTTATFVNCVTNVEQQTLLGHGGRLYDQSNRTILRAKNDAFDIVTEGAGAFLGQFLTAGFALPGGGWNTKHLILGTNHIWVDATGKLRIKNGVPSSDTDGTVVGTQT